MRAKKIATIVIPIIVMFAFIPTSHSDNGILIAYGDHIEMICEDDGLIAVCHTILETANITENVTSTSTYSIDGTLVGEVTFEYDPEIREPDVLYKSENGITTIFVNFTVTLTPLKFAKLKLLYRLKDMLKNENGTWYLRYSFNTDAISPPEIVVKIPKPSTFRKLIVENTVPAPHVFIEENHYYALVYKSPLFKFGNTSTTSIDISYKTVWDFDAIFWYVILLVLSIMLSGVLGHFGKQIKDRLGFKRDKRYPTFEMFRDKEGKFRFRLKAANGEIIATSEGYETKQGCRKGIGVAKEIIKNAQLQDNT